MLRELDQTMQMHAGQIFASPETREARKSFMMIGVIMGIRTRPAQVPFEQKDSSFACEEILLDLLCEFW